MSWDPFGREIEFIALMKVHWYIHMYVQYIVIHITCNLLQPFLKTSENELHPKKALFSEKVNLTDFFKNL